MTHTITALFDDRSDAEAAQERLKQSRVDADHIRILDKQSEGYHETNHSTHEHRGIWGSIKDALLPDNDRHTYEEGVRRGGYVLTVEVDDDAVADAVRVLEEAKTVDIDGRAESWRASGWNHPASVSDNATPSPSYARRDLDRSSSRVRAYGSELYGDRVAGEHHTGSTVGGLANEGIGNVKQATGSVLGSENLRRDGLDQERRGEAQQGKQPD